MTSKVEYSALSELLSILTTNGQSRSVIDIANCLNSLLFVVIHINAMSNKKTSGIGENEMLVSLTVVKPVKYTL